MAMAMRGNLKKTPGGGGPGPSLPSPAPGPFRAGGGAPGGVGRPGRRF